MICQQRIRMYVLKKKGKRGGGTLDTQNKKI